MRRGLSAGAAVGAAAVVWALRIGLQPLQDNSFLTHLATGRLVLDGRIPRTDPFSWTADGTPWVVQSWLAAGAYALAERLGGGHGVLFLQGALMVGLALVVVRLTAPLTSIVPRLAVVGLALGVGSGAWAERPFLFGLLFLGLTLLVAEQGRPHPAWLLPAYAVWVNVHGSFPLGIVLLGALAVGAALDRDDIRPLLRALGWAAAGVLVGALGPLGPRLLLFPIELLGRDDVLADVAEWQSPSFTTGWERLWLLQVLVAVALLVRRPRWRTAVPLLVFCAAALLAVRNVPQASLVLLPGMALGAAGLGSISGARRGLVPTAAVGALALLAGLVVASAASAPAFELGPYPSDQLALLGPGRRVATQDWVGNWLTATRGEGAGVFFDDRFDMYPAELSEDYGVLLAGGPGWAGVLDRHDVEAVVWEREKPLASLLAASADWHVVAADTRWLTAERRPLHEGASRPTGTVTSIHR